MAGEGPRGIGAGSQGVASVFQAFIHICRGQEQAQREREGRKEQHDFTAQNLCDYVAVVHVDQQ